MELRKKIISILSQSYKTRINNLNQSIELTNNVLDLCKNSNYNDLKAKALSQLSLYYMIIGENDKSSDYSKDSIKIFEELNNEKGIADAKYSIASVYYKTNNYHIGLVFLIDALNIYKKFNDYHNISKCEKSLGTVYEYSEDQESAVQSYENAITAAKKINDLNLESNAYNNLSGVYIKQEKINLAEEIINKSIKMKQQTQDIRGLAFAIYGKAKVLFAQKKYILAEQEFNESIRIHQDMGERLGLAMAYQKMGKLYLESNQLDKAKEVASKGLEICRLYNITIIKFKCYYLFYTIYRLEANHIIALEYLEKYLKEKEAVINTQTLKVIDNYDMLVQMKTMQKEAELHKERAEMIEINNRAEEKARVRQEFLSTMSHEIRTPLNAITTVVSMLSENSNKEDFILIDSLKFSSNHLMQIINDILDFNKLELGKMKLELYSTNIKHFTTNFWKTYEFQAIEKKLQFNLIIDSNINDYYLLDETKITQILGNLIGNSIKFTERGEIKLELKLIKKNKSNDTILFKISDTGEGIEKNNIKKIFDSFSQLKNIITRKIGGTGLGLAIVKKLIHLHKSEIYIESEIGSGTIFWFELKLKKSEKIIQNSTIFKNKDLNGLHVLLAEDNAINALIAIKLLSKWGITVDHAVNGLEAIDKSNSNKYDYILMDIHMPELDGYQATKSIRMCLNGNSNTPIFGLTADISVKDNIEFKNYFSGFLLKPIEIDKLKMALSN